MKTKTDVQRAKELVKHTNGLIMFYTGISPENLSDLFFHTAVDWIDGFVGDNQDAQLQLSQQKMFWGFWLNEWTRLQDAFTDRFRLDEDLNWYLYHNGIEVSDKALIAQEYNRFMRYFMLQHKGNSAVMELAFHRRIKQEVTK